MTAAQRRRINRENASHARGPTTEEGKARSRQNALKHGLRAEALTLPGEDPAALAARAEAWNDHFAPRNPAEQHLVDLCVQSTLLSERGLKQHTALVTRQVREAPLRFDEACADEVERHAALFATDPAAALRGLERSAAGCRELIARWSRLRIDLEEQGFWPAPERNEAIRLLGDRPDDIKEGRHTFAVRINNLRARLDYNPEALDWVLDEERIPERHIGNLRLDRELWLPDLDPARAFLLALVDEALARLVAREEWLRVEFEEPARAESGARALLPLDPTTARLILRYHAESRTAFHRAHNALLKSLAREEESENRSDPIAAEGATAVTEAADPVAPLVSPNEPKPTEESPSSDEPETTSDDAADPVSVPGSSRRRVLAPAGKWARAEAGMSGRFLARIVSVGWLGSRLRDAGTWAEAPKESDRDRPRDLAATLDPTIEEPKRTIEDTPGPG